MTRSAVTEKRAPRRPASHVARWTRSQSKEARRLPALRRRESTSTSSPSPPDVDSLRRLARRIEEVHRRAGLRGDRVDDRRPDRPRHPRAGGLGGRDRRRPEGQGPGAAGLQDRPDRLPGAGGALASATWCRRSGCPTRAVREERELARFRLHLVKHKSALKNRIHSTLINFGRPCPVTDLFGVEGRRAARAPRGPRALARQRRRLARADRRPRGARSPRSTAAAGGPRRPPLHPAA